MIANRLFMALFALVLTAVDSVYVIADDLLKQAIVSLATPYIESQTLVGVSIGAIREGQVIEVHLGKTGNPDKHTPNSSTVYELGSVTKVFTGILLGDALARGDLREDQLAQELLPEGVDMPAGKRKFIKLVDLATHRSGLPRLPDNMPNVNNDDPYRDYDSKLAYEFLDQYTLKREPRALQEYSNFGASLLGLLLCRKYGASYEELLSSRITRPLGMKNTFVDIPDSANERVAKPFTAEGTETSPWHFADMPGAGGIRSTTADMLVFAKACLEPSTTPVGLAMEMAWKEHYSGGFTETRMGLGWHFGADGSTRWHNGQTGGFAVMFLVDRKTQRALIVMANTSSRELDRLAMDIDKLLQGKKVEPRSFPVFVKVPAEHMARLTGSYELAPNQLFSVSIVDDKLMVGLTGQQTFQVFAQSEVKWRYKVVEAELTFELPEQGNATALELYQNGIRQKAKRVQE